MPAERVDLEIHNLQGTKPKYAHDESDVTESRPRIPSGISPEAKIVFRRLCKLLKHRRTLTAGDAELLGLYARSFTRHERACSHLESEGEVCAYERLDSNGQPHTFFKENLWLKIATDAEKFMRACLSDLGLNPINRAKVKPTEPKKVSEEEYPTIEQTVLPSEEIDLNSIDEKVVDCGQG